MRGLLRDFPEGVPADTFLARIRGRRSFLVTAWEPLLLTPSPLDRLPPAPWRPGPGGEGGQPWRALQQERAWVFRRMNEPLRVVMAPMFWLGELRTIAATLRIFAVGQGGRDDLLAASLLGDRIRQILATSPTAASAVRHLAVILAPHAPACATLPETVEQGGVGAVEAALHDIFLERLAAGPLHSAVRNYVSLVVDSCNLTAVAKRLRWQVTGRPRLLAGGNIPIPQLERLADRQDMAGLLRRAARLGGPGRVGDRGGVELTLLHAQYLALRKMAREPDGVGAIIDYLWRCRNEARVIGLLGRLATAGPAAVEAEIVP